MPLAQVRGVELNYRVVGDAGPWIALSPGARHPYANFLPIAERIAAYGYRILLYDRRNCGASDVGFDGEGSENEIWADDLHELLKQRGALPAIIGGSSAGCRMSIIFALRHREATRALLLWRVTGGSLAANELAEAYYGQYITLARSGGMAAVAASAHFAECIRARPSNRERLLSFDPEYFIGVMNRWRDDFLRGADMPIIGASEADLRSIQQPACLIPGNDFIHTPAAANNLQRLLPRSELHQVISVRPDDDLLPEWSQPEWDAKDPEVAQIFTAFLTRVGKDC
jgi:pimeloyl-ACP methyl ester carboxylesterase